MSGWSPSVLPDLWLSLGLFSRRDPSFRFHHLIHCPPRIIQILSRSLPGLPTDPATPCPVSTPVDPTNDLDLEKNMTYVIAQPCVDVKDKACVEECPVECIYEGERSLYIHPDECVDCGACEPVCPVEAIFYEDDTPEQWKDDIIRPVRVLRRPRQPRRRGQARPDPQGPPADRRPPPAGLRRSWQEGSLPASTTP